MARTAEQHGSLADIPIGFAWRIGAAADTRIRVVSVVVLTAVAFALLDFFSDVLGHHLARSLTVAAIRASVIGLSAGILMWIGLIAARQRRRFIAAELNRIAERNHRIRNSLQVIADAQHFTEEPLRSMVLESVAKIDDTLKDVLPTIRNT